MWRIWTKSIISSKWNAALINTPAQVKLSVVKYADMENYTFLSFLLNSQRFTLSMFPLKYSMSFYSFNHILEICLFLCKFMTVRGQLENVEKPVNNYLQTFNQSLKTGCYRGALQIPEQRFLPCGAFIKEMFGSHAVKNQLKEKYWFTVSRKIHLRSFLCLLFINQGFRLCGQRQKHTGAEVPRVSMWYSCCSHRHKSPRILFQGEHLYHCLLKELYCPMRQNQLYLVQRSSRTAAQNIHHSCCTKSTRLETQQTVCYLGCF